MSTTSDVPQDVREKVHDALWPIIAGAVTQYGIDLATDAAIAALRGAGWRAVPEGHVVVPNEPTMAMLHAGSRGAACLGTPLTRTASAYRAMLTAAPEPPA